MSEYGIVSLQVGKQLKQKESAMGSEDPIYFFMGSSASEE